MRNNILRLIITSTLVTALLAYHIKLIQQKEIPPDIDLSPVNTKQQAISIKTFKRMFLFPYTIYEHQTRGSLNRLARSYLFLKDNFNTLQPALRLSNATNSEQQQKIIYSLLPEAVMIEGDPMQFLQLQLLPQSLTNEQLIITNGSLQREDEVGDKKQLSIYSFELHNFILKVANKAKILMKNNQTEQDLKTYIQDKNKQSLSPIPIEQIQNGLRREFALEKMLENTEELYKGEDFTHVLFSKVLTRHIERQTKWKALFDGFSLHYFEATISSNQSLTDNQNNIEIVNIIKRAGEQKRSLTISQPLHFLSLKTIEILDICSQDGTTQLLLSDLQNIYLLDITKKEWHMRKNIHHNSTFFQNLFFNSKCTLLGLHTPEPLQSITINGTSQTHLSTQIIEFYPQYNKITKQIKCSITSHIQIEIDHLVVCCSSDCTLIELRHFSTFSLENSSSIFEKITKDTEIKLRTSLDNSNLISQLEIFQPKINKQTILQLPNEYTSMNNSDITSKQRIFYSQETYFNKTKFIVNEMNRIIYRYVKSVDFFNDTNFQTLYQEMANEVNSNQCFTEAPISASQTEFQFNSVSDWTSCTIDIRTNVYLLLTLTFKHLFVSNYKLYICSTYLEKNSNPVLTDCSPLIDQTSPLLRQEKHYFQLKSSHFYKIYVVKETANKSQNFPTMFIKDIERQQLEMAQKIFFFIMLSLSVVMATLVLFLLLKNVLYNLLIYYGYINERREPTYPLNWFALKTKLKRLRQMEILKFTSYQPSITDTEGSHCCFCLDVLHSRAVVAELYCGHEFHKECFNDWIKNEPHARCPTCRRPFTSAGLAEFRSGPSSNQQLPLQ